MPTENTEEAYKDGVDREMEHCLENIQCSIPRYDHQYAKGVLEG